MRTKRPTAHLFKAHRRNLAEHLDTKGIAVIHSNDLYPSNADALLPFKQSNDLFYLSGITQEETILVLFPDAVEEKDREILFLRKPNQNLAIWEGHKLSKEQATERTGMKRIEWVESFDTVLGQLALQAEVFFLSTNEYPRLPSQIETRNHRFIKECQNRFPLHRYGRLAPLINKLRMQKSEEEIEFTKRACEITEAGFRRILKQVKPGMGEWEIEAEFIHEFIKSGSRGFAYNPIIAGGKNACTLHYVENDCELTDGEMLLLDVGAEYGGWNADMTRTIPINGKFSQRQRAVYDAVLRILRFASSILRPGILMPDYQKHVIEEMEKELVNLGLFTEEEAASQDETKPLVKKYFMHGTSHHLGLDVHDVSTPYQPVTPGMIFTIEPGIYIAEENLGIRLENDFLIGEKENIDLMEAIPIEADEIESLMAQ
ncbi:MAG: aminopeptidase P N-terminal domain-containing protein [Akkermansiaceae bacterium]